MDWDKLRIFHTVAEAGSFTMAAKRLNVSQSAASRQIRALEDSLDVSLFNRHARGLVLTNEGEQLFDTTKHLSDRIETVTGTLLEAKDKPSGALRVTTMVSFGAVWLTPHLKEFVLRYPDIQVQLSLADEDLDLATREADVAIRFHPSEQADLIQRPLVPVHFHVYASPEYLDRKGAPRRAEDLDQHDIIVYGPVSSLPVRSIDWILTVGSTGYTRRPVLEVNNIYAVLQAIKAGMGLAAIPDYLVANNRQLVRVLGHIQSPTLDTYFVYPRELRGAKRVAVFRDYLLQQVRRDAGNL